jgi:nucleotide-binding universal stress UspA family protein
VAVVPLDYRDADHAIGRVGVAYDGSEESKAALQAAVDAARATKATLRVIHVHNDEPMPAPVPRPAGDYIEMGERLERAARASLEQTVAELPADVQAAQAIFMKGASAVELANASSELDLLVTGSRCYGPLRSTLLGGVTGPLLRLAHCPVVVVPRGVQAPLGELFAERQHAIG